MFNSNRIYSVLSNTSAITTLLDSYTDNSGTRKAIFHDNIVPANFSGSKSINYYRSDPINATLEYEDEVYTLNCRSDLYEEAENIQKAVKDAFNRTASSTDGFFTCRILSIISPADERDNYNGPIEVRLRKR